MSASLGTSFPPVLDSVKREYQYNALTGVQYVTEDLKTPSSHSNTQTQFDINSPDLDMMLDKVLMLRVPVTMTVSNAAAGRSNYNPVCPVSFPVTSAISSIEVRINGSAFTGNPCEVKKVLERHQFTKALKRRYLSGTPTMPDNDCLLGYGAAGGMERRLVENPLSRKCFNSSDEGSRYTFPFTVVDGATNVRTYQYEFYEPVWVNLFELISEEAIFNIDKLQIKINWNPLNSMFKRVTPLAGAITTAFAATQDAETALDAAATFATTFTANPDIRIRWYKPSGQLPATQELPFFRVLTEKKQATEVFADVNNHTTLINTNFANQYSCVPDTIFIHARRPNTYSITELDSCFAIERLTVKIGGVPYLQSATPIQLWQMTTRNGIDVSFDEWYNRGQCIVAIKLGKDIGGWVPGTRTEFNLTIEATLSNQGLGAVAPEMHLTILEPSRLLISRDRVEEQSGFTEDAVSTELEAGNIVEYEESDNKPGEAVVGLGGKLNWGKIRKNLGQALNIGSQAASIGSQFAPAQYKTGLAETSKNLGIARQIVGSGMVKKRGGMMRLTA